MSEVEETLKERGDRYGDFSDHARIAQGLQDLMRSYKKVSATFSGEGIGHVNVEEKPWDKLDPVKRQALTVMADKIARILSGDPEYADNWHDIQGYAKLVEDRLEK